MGNKVLELFIKNILNVTDNIIAPSFYLYELRLWADHADVQSKYEDVVTQLGLSKSAGYEEIYSSLIDNLLSFLKRLLCELDEANA